MNFEIERREFLRGLGLIQSVTGRKTTLPILSHILLEWDKNSLYLTGTDLETGIREELMATIQQEGKASVSGKKLYEIVKELPDEIIHIQKRENQWITLRCGKSIFNLAGLDSEEYPALPSFAIGLRLISIILALGKSVLIKPTWRKLGGALSTK